MGSEWKEYSLGEIAENISRPFVFEGRESVVFINTGDVLKGEFLHSKFSSPTGLPGQAKKKIIKGDILFSEIRPANGRYAEVTFDAEDYVVSTKFMVIRLTSKEVYQPYFLMQLTSEQTLLEFQRIAESRSGTFPQITFDAISYYPFIFPPLFEQKEIARILGLLNDKIELNRRMNETLEGMAQALFKSWFVDFDPVIDNALEAGNQIPEEFSERAKTRRHALASGTANREVAKQFPAAFNFTEEMGWIPEGWECKQWGDIAKLEYGKNLKGYRDGPGNIPVYGTNGAIGMTDKALCNNDGIVIGRKGAYRGVHYSPVPFYAIDTAFYLVPIIKMSNKWAYYEILQFDINGMDSGSAIPSTSRDDFYSLWSIVPSHIVQLDFDRIVSSLYEKKESNNSTNFSFARLRDTLLPKLISGELRIPEAEKLAEEAVE